MTANRDADAGTDLQSTIGELVVATSEAEPHADTVERLFGDHDPGEAVAARDTIARLFGEAAQGGDGGEELDMDAFFGGVGAAEDAGSTNADDVDPNDDSAAACVPGELLGALGDSHGGDDDARHEIHVGERVEYAGCIDGALIAAELADADAVTVRSRDPESDGVVVYDLGEGDVAVSPDDALVSMGMAESAPSGADMIALGVAMAGGDDDPDRYVEEPAALFCRNFNSFEDVETYERWAADADAVSVAIPAAAFAGMIRDLVASPAFD